MKELIAQTGVIAAALLIVAGVVFGLNDRTTLVPAPSVALEGFLRTLSAERYKRAVPYLAQDLADSISPDKLEELFRPIRDRAGEIINVTGEREQIDGEHAEAEASLETRSAGTITIALPMQLEHGVWKITELKPLATPGP